MIERQQIQQLNEMPIENVASRLGLSVVRHHSLCPFHNDTHPSLTFDTRKNRYRCFVCGAHGGPIDLVMNHGHMGFVEACKWLADGSNVMLERWQPAVKEAKTAAFDASRYERHIAMGGLSQRAMDFLYRQRKLDPRVVRFCRLTSWQDREGVEWLQIPYYSPDWHLIGIQWRNLTPDVVLADGQKAPRFRFPRGSRCSVYNMPVLSMLHEGEPLYITEGSSDCWAMLSSGHKAISIPSATMLKTKDVELLCEYAHRLNTPFHIYPDQDEPGEKLFLQLRALLPNLTRHQLPPGCKDYAEYYLKGQKR